MVRPRWDDSILLRPLGGSLSAKGRHDITKKAKPSSKSKLIIHDSEDDAIYSSTSCSPISPPYYAKNSVEEEDYYIKFNILTVEQVKNNDILKSSRSLAAEMGKISEEIINPYPRHYSLIHSLIK